MTSDYPFFDPVNDAIWTDSPDIVNFSRNVLDPTSLHFDFFLYCLQRPLSFASIMRLPVPNLYIENEPIELIETIYSSENVLYCAILRFENTLFIVCKGTTQRSEMIIDSRLELTPHPTLAGKVHDGFMHLYKIIQVKVEQTLKLFPNSHLVFTGTSLGACISHLLFIDSMTPPVQGLGGLGRTISNVVFAPPKCGNKTFYNSFTRLIESRGGIIRGYVNVVDMIPRMPPFGYGKLPKKWQVVFKLALGDVYKNHIIAYTDYFISKGVDIENKIKMDE